MEPNPRHGCEDPSVREETRRARIMMMHRSTSKTSPLSLSHEEVGKVDTCQCSDICSGQTTQGIQQFPTQDDVDRVDKYTDRDWAHGGDCKSVPCDREAHPSPMQSRCNAVGIICGMSKVQSDWACDKVIRDLGRDTSIRLFTGSTGRNRDCEESYSGQKFDTLAYCEPTSRAVQEHPGPDGARTSWFSS